MIKHEFGNKESQNVLIQLVDDHDLAEMKEEVETIRELAGDDFCLLALQVKNWNKDLSPWKAKAAFGKEDFGGGAEETLQEVEKYTQEKGKKYYIGGYSLAGLFALWAVCRSDDFCGAACASPSVWFPGFLDYVKKEKIRTEKVYLSLGDKEEKTRNALMSQVGDCIREIHQDLGKKGVKCQLEWNPGNHFREAGIRMGKGFGWLCEKCESNR